MKKLYFIRHGLSQGNVDSVITGHTDSPLTNEGRAQAKAAGQEAKGLGIDLIVSSPLSRALETAQIIAKEIGYPLEKIHTNKLLIERNHGAMEGKPYVPYFNYDVVDGAESDEEIVGRAKEALDWVSSLKGHNVLIVSHGTTGRAIRSHVLVEYDMKHPEQLGNAEIVRWL